MAGEPILEVRDLRKVYRQGGLLAACRTEFGGRWLEAW